MQSKPELKLPHQQHITIGCMLDFVDQKTNTFVKWKLNLFASGFVTIVADRHLAWVITQSQFGGSAVSRHLEKQKEQFSPTGANRL